MSKHLVEIFNEGAIRKTIELSNTAPANQVKGEVSKGPSNEEYKVVGMEDARQINPQF